MLLALRWRPPGLPWAPGSCCSVKGPRKMLSPLRWCHPCCCSLALLAVLCEELGCLARLGRGCKVRQGSRTEAPCLL